MRITESLYIENDRRGYQEVCSVWGIRIKGARINEVWFFVCVCVCVCVCAWVCVW